MKSDSVNGSSINIVPTSTAIRGTRKVKDATFPESPELISQKYSINANGMPNVEPYPKANM